MRAVEEFLAIPLGYSRWMGGLRWSDDGETIEYLEREAERERMFAFAGEVSLFLEGFVPSRTPICFGFVLHWMHLLGVGRRSEPPVAPEAGRQPGELAWLFHDLGRPLRNAGALAAEISRELPKAADPPELAEICGRLTQRPTLISFRKALSLPDPAAELPPLSPLIFEARVLRALASYTTAELRDWLRTGRSPVVEAGDTVAREIVAQRPQSLVEALDLLTERPRLTAAASLIAQLDAALTLPPRRLNPAEMPAGGYADIGTRGQPEQILPSQFALDAQEFLRRLAQKELLYFHREEPRSKTAEQLWLLIDQGVRTWGDVRLVLAGAALAMVRRAIRRGAELRVATTARPDQIYDPREITTEGLARLFEASDLSTHPARLVETAAPDQDGARRDLVLLTHPRSLAEPELIEAARRLAVGSRLFAVAVDREGEVGLHELRDGLPVRISRSRVTLQEGPAAGPPIKSERPSESAWSGPVEPPGFPFALGSNGPIPGRLFDFDEAGKWLFVPGPLGSLDAWSLDGTVRESLPRALYNGKPLTQIEHLVGVAGGVAIVASSEQRRAFVHYDLATRRCRVHAMTFMRTEYTGIQYYAPLNSVVLHYSTGPNAPYDQTYRGFDLETGRISIWKNGRVRGTQSERASLACALALASAHAGHRPSWELSTGHRHPHLGLIPADWLAVLRGGEPPALGPDWPDPRLRLSLDGSTGALQVRTPTSTWPAFTPMSDGQPVLKDAQLRWAESAGDLLAASFVTVEPGTHELQHQLRLFSGPKGRSLSIFSLPESLAVGGFALSRDGRWLALLKVNMRQVEVLEIKGHNTRLITPLAAAPEKVEAQVHRDGLIIRRDRMFYHVSWARGVLEVDARETQGGVGPRSGHPARFFPWIFHSDTAAAHAPEDAAVAARSRGDDMTALTAEVDVLGQILFYDGDRKRICVMVGLDERFAAWMPDGTRFGHPSLLGRPPTIGAAERVGGALRQASARGSM